ncbi:MAG: winged helix DNA-binding domain-containing protein, partial [Nonomuraea sp.]|nr:winged helix DNA-binding domain-containing protein [Nonomuraea sp.]
MRISVEQRRARLALRQGLARPYDGVVEAAESVVVLHATDPATVFLSLAARLRAPGHAAIERALYEDGDLVRMHGMRRTLFVVPADLVAAVQASSTAPIAARERKVLAKAMQDSGYAA